MSVVKFTLVIFATCAITGESRAGACNEDVKVQKLAKEVKKVLVTRNWNQAGCIT